MANASVEKLKALGIRHGEKAVLSISATLFVVFVVVAILNPVLDMKPEELKTSANNARSNLSAKQSESDILAKLEKDGIKEPNFQKVIEGQIVNALKPDGYRARLDWVSPEPGAGLIRDQPDLIAPTELTAFPGRGGILMYALDDKGERKIDTGADAKKRPGGRPGPGGGAAKKQTPEEIKRAELEEEKRKAAFAGNKPEPTEKGKAAEEAVDVAPQGPFVEETKGKRWVVITAVLDNAKLKKNYLMALKNEAIAYPNFKRVDVERQVLQSDGSWSEWALTEKEKNWEVLDNLPMYDEEYVPESQRPSALVDTLPYLKAGYWTGVHVAKLVPPEILNKPKDAPTGGGGGGGVMGMSSSMSSSSAGMPKAAPGGGNSGMGNRQGMQAVMGGGGRKGGMAMGEGAVGGGGPVEANFTKYDEGTLMIRSLDFTIEPDQTYRFRLRIVVVNPNLDREDVNPGVDVTSKQLYGPWSEPSPIVSVPADVVAYAQSAFSQERRDDLVSFQVVRWDPGSGQTVIKPDSRGPGQIIGEYGSAPVPNSEGSGPKSSQIDFNSHSIVLDTFGGRQKLPDIGVPRNQFDVPALAMIVEPDGSVVMRSQALDQTDEVREDMEANYEQAIKDSTKKRESGNSRRGGVGAGRGKGRGRQGRAPSNSGGGRSGGGGSSQS